MGRLRRSALRASRCLVKSFSLASSSLRAASHASRVAILGRLITVSFAFTEWPGAPAHIRVMTGWRPQSHREDWGRHSPRSTDRPRTGRPAPPAAASPPSTRSAKPGTRRHPPALEAFDRLVTLSYGALRQLPHGIAKRQSDLPGRSSVPRRKIVMSARWDRGAGWLRVLSRPDVPMSGRALPASEQDCEVRFPTVPYQELGLLRRI